MGQYMNRVWNVWKMNISELFWLLATMLGGTVFGMIIMTITLIAGEKSYLVVGSFIALIIWIMVFIIFGGTGFEREFNMAVAMGRTRREVFICCYIVKLAHVWIGLAVLYILNLVEKTYYKIFFKESICEGNIVELVLGNWVFLGAGILLPVLYMFIGMLLMKFQKKALWGIWGIWMTCSLILPNMHRISERIPREVILAFQYIQDFVVNIGEGGWLLIVAMITLLLFLVTGAALRKQAVSQI